MAHVLVNMPSQFPDQASGVSRYAFALLRHLLARTDHRFTLRSPFDRDRLPPDLDPKRLRLVTVPRPRNMIVEVLLSALPVRRLCRALDVDVVLNIDPYGAPIVGIPSLMVVHDLYFRTLPAMIGRRAVVTNDLIFRLMLATNDRIVCISDATRSELAAHYPASARKSRTLLSDSTTPLPSDGDLPREIADPYLLVVGNWTPNKNFECVAEAMRALGADAPPLRVVHVGIDPGERIATGLAGSAVPVTRLAGIDDRRLAGLYRHARMLVVPSLAEGFCLPVVEAQRLGCPVVAAERPALPEIAGAGALYFDPARPAELAERIRRLALSDEARAALVAAGHANAARFSWSATADGYARLIDELAGSAAARPAEAGRVIPERAAG